MVRKRPFAVCVRCLSRSPTIAAATTAVACQRPFAASKPPSPAWTDATAGGHWEQRYTFRPRDRRSEHNLDRRQQKSGVLREADAPTEPQRAASLALPSQRILP